MSDLPVVSIVGRPNVGKSSLFNRILRQKVAVVDDTPGVTRDRNYRETMWNGYAFSLVDTGGLVPSSRENIPVEIYKQVDTAVKESSVIIFLVEALPGPTDVDDHVARRLRKMCSEKVILAVNKTESPAAFNEISSHLSLGCGEPFPISALHGKGVADLLDEVCIKLGKMSKRQSRTNEAGSLSIAIVGRPNAGKSSLVNKLLKHERMIVDNQPGTTRDAVDSILIYKDLQIRLIDTAGLRKKTQVHNDIEYFCNLRALNSIRRCDICVLLIDTAEKIGEQDLKILTQVLRYKKGMIICWNKWDSITKDHKTFDQLVAEVRKTYRETQFIPMLSISALTGQRVGTVIETAITIRKEMDKRIGTSELRETFFSWTKTHAHPFVLSGEIRFLGFKQIADSFPHFVCFCNKPENIVASYKRYLLNKIYETYSFIGCPVALNFKPAGHSAKHKDKSIAPDYILEKE